ncbi:MAG: hypothetical protein RJQ09_04105 [Cyclobacteriaceae bacterium]
MNDFSKENELTPQEQSAFENLRQVSVPPELEGKVVDGLKQADLLNVEPKKIVTMKNWIYTAAASIAFFVIGYYVAGMQNTTQPEPAMEEPMMTTADNQTKYVVLLWEDDAFKGDDQELIGEYSNWGQDWGQKGKVVGGEKLAYDYRWFGESFEEAASPGILSGFFVIAANSYDEAIDITETHPHTKYGGRIELREIEKL